MFSVGSGRRADDGSGKGSDFTIIDTGKPQNGGSGGGWGRLESPFKTAFHQRFFNPTGFPEVVFLFRFS